MAAADDAKVRGSHEGLAAVMQVVLGSFRRLAWYVVAAIIAAIRSATSSYLGGGVGMVGIVAGVMAGVMAGLAMVLGADVNDEHKGCHDDGHDVKVEEHGYLFA